MALPKYVSLAEVAEALTYSPNHIRRLIAVGEFPQMIKLGARRWAFDEQDIHDWIAKKREETQTKKAPPVRQRDGAAA